MLLWLWQLQFQLDPSLGNSICHRDRCIPKKKKREREDKRGGGEVSWAGVE